MFSVIQDQQSSELSQGHIARRAKRLKVEQQELKLPRVVALDACQVCIMCSCIVHSLTSALVCALLCNRSVHILVPCTKGCDSQNLIRLYTCQKG